MRCVEARPLLSSIHDGETRPGGPLREHLAGCPTCRGELAELEALSRRLAVPEERPDPSFVARFRARRDDARRSAAAWRWLAVRLVPLSAAAAAAAAITVIVGARAPGELRELEAQALRSGVASVTAQTVVADRVLGLEPELLPATE